jgi:tetratricopeptide (TPR) repeat protein
VASTNHAVASCRTAFVLAILACFTSGRATAHRDSAIDLLDRYATGQFEAVVNDLHQAADFAQLLKETRADAPAWIDAGGPEDRARRELAAATFALEAARIDEWREWKRIVKPPAMVIKAPVAVVKTPHGDEQFQPLNTLYWAPAPLFVEWGCALLRRDATPRPIERVWQLAALAVAQRSEDPQFLVGDTKLGQGVEAGEILNEQNEIRHLLHVQERFPNEARFVLAQGIARFRDWPEDAHVAFAALGDHADLGGEAHVRDADVFLREGKTREALDHLTRAEAQTRDPYLLYLAGYLRGVASLREAAPQQAEAAFRRALAEWPRGQSASASLAALLFDQGRRLEAQAIANAMLDAPLRLDPVREFVHADDRFWPIWIAQLRAEIRR